MISIKKHSLEEQMKKSINKIITAPYYGARPCEYVDLRYLRVKYDVIKWLHFRVIKMYEPYVLLEKLTVQGGSYKRTGIRECFRYHEMGCYLYSQDDIENALQNRKVIHIPAKIKKYE